MEEQQISTAPESVLAEVDDKDDSKKAKMDTDVDSSNEYDNDEDVIVIDNPKEFDQFLNHPVFGERVNSRFKDKIMSEAAAFAIQYGAPEPKCVSMSYVEKWKLVENRLNLPKKMMELKFRKYHNVLLVGASVTMRAKISLNYSRTAGIKRFIKNSREIELYFRYQLVGNPLRDTPSPEKTPVILYFRTVKDSVLVNWNRHFKEDHQEHPDDYVACVDFVFKDEEVTGTEVRFYPNNSGFV